MTTKLTSFVNRVLEALLVRSEHMALLEPQEILASQSIDKRAGRPVHVAFW